ncbi:MAG: IceA2 protein [Verrucomicrobiota bacterium]
MSSPIPKLRRAILRLFTAAFVLCILAVLSVLTLPPAMAADASTVRVKGGHIQEYVNGSLRRSYGSDIVDASTDGEIVAAVTKNGRIQEYVNGSLRRSYGSDVVRVRVSGGSVFGDLKNGRTAEYVNGSLRRTF